MGYREPTIDEVKVTTSLTHKGMIAKAGSVFYIATLKANDRIYTLFQAVTRKNATIEQEHQFQRAMKEKLWSDIFKTDAKEA